MKIVIHMSEELAKRILRCLDVCLRTDSYGRTTRLRDAWYRSHFLNALRRVISPALIALKYKIRFDMNNILKLHIGCGTRHFDGYVNIDFRKTRSTDLVCDIRKLPYPDNSVTLIETYHVIEHLPRHDFPKALKEWQRVLVTGGKLVIECPDFDEVIREYVQGNKKRIDNIFGRQRFAGDAHLFGYNFDRLKNLLEEGGFDDVQNAKPKDYHIMDEPCLRVECIKK
jgi:predicted SAM-dependent methyltransferase